MGAGGGHGGVVVGGTRVLRPVCAPRASWHHSRSLGPARGGHAARGGAGGVDRDRGQAGCAPKSANK
eukprot:1182219-Prorocentrum_minimum.AAC.1